MKITVSDKRVSPLTHPWAGAGECWSGEAGVAEIPFYLEEKVDIHDLVAHHIHDRHVPGRKTACEME
jgi:hypothetical protein